MTTVASAIALESNLLSGVSRSNLAGNQNDRDATYCPDRNPRTRGSVTIGERFWELTDEPGDLPRRSPTSVVARTVEDLPEKDSVVNRESELVEGNPLNGLDGSNRLRLLVRGSDDGMTKGDR